MTTSHTSYVLIIGFSPFTRNCCTHRLGTMPLGMVKRTGPAMIGSDFSTSSATQEIEACCQIHRLDWRRVLCGHIAGVVPCPLGSSSSSPITAKGGWVQSCQSLMGGSDCRSWWYSTAMAGGAGQQEDAVQGGWLQSERNTYADGHSQSRLDTTTCWEVPGCVSHIEARCYCRRVQGQRRLSLGDYQSREVTSLCIPSQWAINGWVVFRGLCLAYSVARCLHDGNQQLAQGCRLWFSPHTEEVWCPKHVGQYSPNLAPVAAAHWGYGGLMVLSGRKRGETLYKQVQSTWGWQEERS